MVFLVRLGWRHVVQVELDDGFVVWLGNFAEWLATCAVLLHYGLTMHWLFLNNWVVMGPCLVKCSLPHEVLVVQSLRKQWHLYLFNDVRYVVFGRENGVVCVLRYGNALVTFCRNAKWTLSLKVICSRFTSLYGRAFLKGIIRLFRTIAPILSFWVEDCKLKTVFFLHHEI